MCHSTSNSMLNKMIKPKEIIKPLKNNKYHIPLDDENEFQSPHIDNQHRIGMCFPRGPSYTAYRGIPLLDLQHRDSNAGDVCDRCSGYD